MNSIRFKISKSTLIIICGLVITLIMKAVFMHQSHLTEALYYRGIYRIYRNLWDFFFAWIPVPVFYLWLALMLLLFIIFLRNFILFKTKRLRLIKRTIIILSIHFIWFYWAWGFNYGRATLGERWNLETPVSDELFINELFRQTRNVDSTRNLYKKQLENYQFNIINIENQIRNELIRFQLKNGFLGFERLRCRNLSIKGSLLIWSTSGVYLPFAGESQFDGGLHNLSKPFTMAHELCHGMGWTHEGDCNFIAYLVCRQCEDPFIRYSGELSYWRYLYANASRVHPQEFRKVKENLNPDVNKDIQEINQALQAYPEIFPALRNWMYDWYLKKNGIANGDKSYSEIIRMLINYKTRKAI